MKYECPFEILSDEQIEKNKRFIPVDDWVPTEQDLIFKHCNGFIFLPISEIFKIPENNPNYMLFNRFNIIKKRCYNGEAVRQHTCHYMNYFSKFYDTDNELLLLYSKIKYMIDCEPLYNLDAFKYDVKRYFLSPTIKYKVLMMNEDNYMQDLNYKNKENKSLEYTNDHGKILMQISIFINMLIPVMIHFIYTKKVLETDNFILGIYDIILSEFGPDIYNKLYETTITSIQKSYKDNQILWEKQDIRGKNITTHSLEIIENILLNIVPKYEYNRNIITFNYQSIKWTTRYQVTTIGYEYNFIPLSASNRDEDNNSEFDKFESFLTKQDESLYMQNQVNSDKTIEVIENIYGPFDQDEIDFYLKELNMSTFQQNLVFNLFYKYFGDPMSIKAINKEDYIKLMIASKKLLLANGLRILPYVLTGKITKQVERKMINKREQTKLMSSSYYEQIKQKYRSDKIEKQILSMIASILSSDFEILDFHDPEIHGIKLEIIPDILVEELLLYVCMI